MSDSTQRRWGLLPMSLLPAAFVDRLPESWWALGNIHFVWRTAQTWSFGVMPLPRTGEAVRTIDMFGHHVAWGRRPFDFAASERYGDVLARRREEDERKFWAEHGGPGQR